MRGGAAVVLRSKSPLMIRQEIYADAVLLPGDPHPDRRAASEEGIDPRRVSFTVARDAVCRRISDPGSFPPDQLDEALADLNFEITFHRSLVPERPGRRYARETKRPGGRYKTRKRGQPSR